MILKTLNWLTKSLDRVEDMERRLRNMDDLVRGFGGLEYRVGYLEDRWQEARERLDLMSDALDEAGEEDPVPRVSVVEVAAAFDIPICSFCATSPVNFAKEPCRLCSLYREPIEPGGFPSRFELREDLR